MRFLVAIFIFLNILTCHADVYVQTDKNGSTVFSDTPLNNQAKKVNLQGASASQSSNSSPTTETTIEKTEKPTKPNLAYTTFQIETPKDQETIQNQATIPFDITLEPTLQEGDQVQLYLDGNPVGNPSVTTHLQLQQVERGSHQVFAVIIDKNKKLIKQSSAITIYVHSASAASIKKTKQNIQRGGGI